MNWVLRTTCLKGHNKPIVDFVFSKQRPVFTHFSCQLLIRRQQHNHQHDNTDGDSLFEDLPPKKIRKYLDEEKKFNGKLVYVGRLTSQLMTAKTLSLSSSLLGLGLMPFLSKTLESSSYFSQAFVYGTTGFFIFVTPLFAQFLTRRYVSRLYYNYEEKKFKAVMLSFFMTEYKLEFALDDIHVPDMPGMFTTAQLKSTKRNLFIDFNSVADIGLVQKIYGYDKPFDVKKYTDEKEK